MATKQPVNGEAATPEQDGDNTLLDTTRSPSSG